MVMARSLALGLLVTLAGSSGEEVSRSRDSHEEVLVTELSRESLSKLPLPVNRGPESRLPAAFLVAQTRASRKK